MPGSLITEEIASLVGRETEPEQNRFPISAEMAYDVADSIEDYNPLYVDPDYAQNSRFGGLLCPPLAAWKDIAPPIGYFGAGQEWHFEVPLPFNSYGLNGGQRLAVPRAGLCRVVDYPPVPHPGHIRKAGPLRCAGFHSPGGNPDRPARHHPEPGPPRQHPPRSARRRTAQPGGGGCRQPDHGRRGAPRPGGHSP